MHISELITILKTIQEKHGDIPVMGTWETVIQPIDAITVEETNRKICLLSVDEYALPYGCKILEEFYPSKKETAK